MFKRINISNGPYIKANIIGYERYAEHSLVYLSLIGYNYTISNFIKHFKKRDDYLSVEGSIGHRFKHDEYEFEVCREDGLAHAIIYKKDSVINVGTELQPTMRIISYIYTQSDHALTCESANIVPNYLDNEAQITETQYPQEIVDKVYTKLCSHSPIPILKSWMGYLIDNMISHNYLRRLTVIKSEAEPMNILKLQISFPTLIDLVCTGLKNGNITINGNPEASAEIQSIAGMDQYLNTYAEQLIQKIHEYFKPRFNPQTDSYSPTVEKFARHTAGKGLRLYDAQKAVIQATSSNLKDNNAAFIIGEMGTGKTIMSLGTIYANADKCNTVNIVLSPGHLVEKWKREIKTYMPKSRAIIINDFDDFINIESLIYNKKRGYHLFLIIANGIAKSGYYEKPCAVWSKSKNKFLCPSCGQPLYKVVHTGTGRWRRTYHVDFKKTDFGKKYYNRENANAICPNKIVVWDNQERMLVEKDCGASLWAPLTKNEQEWIKLPEQQGWIMREHVESLYQEYISKTNHSIGEGKFLSALSQVRKQILNDEKIAVIAPQKYPLARYIAKNFKGEIDYLIADEIHEYKSGTAQQAFAYGDLTRGAKKTICLTGTLLNGYSEGLFHILFRTFPSLMQSKGFRHKDITAFNRAYGVIQKTERFNTSTNRRTGSSVTKSLPGVSPLVFTEFLLETATFITLSDIAEGLPSYQEIPIAIQPDEELAAGYRQLESNLRTELSRSGTKIMGSALQSLLTYPDMPYDQPPIIHPDTGAILVVPQVLPRMTRPKDTALLDIVNRKKANDERVLIFCEWSERTDVHNRLSKLLTDAGHKVAVLKSSGTAKTRDREAWIKNQVEKENIDVLICNPRLVETGLDLIDFTAIVFYQIGYNLFTLRQASRRSWRLSQRRPVEVFFLYYTGTVQEKALSLMATKLQAATAIEGKFSEEGLQALSNHQDLLTQIANSVTQGIECVVNQEVFRKASSLESSMATSSSSVISFYDLYRTGHRKRKSEEEKAFMDAFYKKEKLIMNL